MRRADHDELPSSGDVRVRVVEHGTTISVALEGELDLRARHPVKRALTDAFARSPERVVLDLSRLTFMDSTAVHVAIDADELAGAQGIQLVLIPASPPLQRIFGFTELGEGLAFTASLELAPRGLQEA